MAPSSSHCRRPTGSTPETLPRSRSRRSQSPWRAAKPTGQPRRAGAVPASAIVLGSLMLLAGVVAKAGGGPLVPSGGGTFDGTIRQTSGTSPVPVDRWSDVAITYDGATLQLYVNGRQVSSQDTTGTIQTPSNPLWIGGNLPYGEHFDGLIDEVRIYDRALSQREIRRDMVTPVAPATGLVAAYAFDAGSGRTVADSSGSGNTGEMSGATWARGRYGDALRFDGEAAVVRVRASQSLNLRRAMTLSGWIRPSAPQTGWRTIVQRQTDAYMLTAGSDRQNRYGLIDDLRAALLAAAAIWFFLVIATARSPWTVARRHSWWAPVALFVVGSARRRRARTHGSVDGAHARGALVGRNGAARSRTDHIPTGRRSMHLPHRRLARGRRRLRSHIRLDRRRRSPHRGARRVIRYCRPRSARCGRASYSTVTVLARLRGWSTLSPRSRAIR